MYRCEDCGLLFEEPAGRTQYIGECHGRPVYDDRGFCPSCASSEISQVEPCQGCGGWFYHEQLREDYCDACGEGISQEAGALWSKALAVKSTTEKRFLRKVLQDDEMVTAGGCTLLDLLLEGLA